MKIELRKPQQTVGKQSIGVELSGRRPAPQLPFFFRLLLAATYLLSALALLFAVQWLNPTIQLFPSLPIPFGR